MTEILISKAKGEEKRKIYKSFDLSISSHNLDNLNCNDTTGVK